MKLNERELLVYVVGLLIQPQHTTIVNDVKYFGYSEDIVTPLIDNIYLMLDVEPVRGK